MNKLLKTILIFVLFALSAKSALAAAGDLSVKISLPKSPYNQNNFNVNFVALDQQNRPVTVKCFKKGPNDSGFVQFGSDFNLIAGGTSDNCVVDGNVVNSQGTYQFYVQAVAGSDTVNSGTVSVDYNTSGPGTPVSYSKEKVNDCTWKIKFTTASDNGKTTHVEAYRSDNPTYNADSGNMFYGTAIGSGQNGETSITVPDCTKTWYFSVRAFDDAGNGSGIVGDSNTITVTSNTTTLTPTTGPVSVPGGGTGQVGNGEKNGGKEGEVSPSATSTENNANPQVEGASTTAWLKSWWFRDLVILIVLVSLGYGFKKKFLNR